MSPFNTDDKTFRIMRLTFIALFVFSFSLLASVHSQTMRVNINANNESTHSILGNTGQIRIGETDILLTQETDYPWDGSVKLTISTSQPLEKEIRLRIPNWCKTYDLSINGKRINVSEEKGYAVIKDWKSQDVIALDMDMPVEIVAADPHVKENFGKRAIQRGPLVYCMEEIDNPVYFDQIQLSPSTTFQTAFASDILNGIKTIKTNGRAQSATFIPYYAWDNRKAGKMRVWIPYNE